jgi:hypothetical protein
VASTDEPERIEVELLSSAPSGASRPGSVTSTASHDPQPLPGVGRRGVVVPLVVGIVALAAGWVIGRGSGSAPSIAPDETSVTEAADPIDSIAPVPTTAASSSPPTSIASATSAAPAVAPDVYVVTERAVDVAAELLGQPMEIVAFGNGRQLMRLDLATARLVASEVVAQPFGRTRLLVGPTWALLPSTEAGLGSTLVRNEGRPVEVDVGPASLIVGVADADSLWMMFTPVSTTGIVVHRRGVDGRPRDEIGVVPSAPTSIDPAGGVVVELPGGTFGVRPQPAVETEAGDARVIEPVVAPITDGRLLALGADVAVAEECDALLVCSTYVIDRASGERRALDVDGALSGLVPYGLAGTATVAPGGGAAVVEVLEPNDRASAQRSLGVIDLETGVVTEIGPTQDVGQTAWTPDGRFVLFIRGGRIAAYDIETGVTVVVADELVAIDAFGVRVAGDGPDD